MLMLAIGLFAVAAVAGLVVAVMHVKGRTVPVPAALVHGLFAASGLVVLIVTLLGGDHPGVAIASLVLFVAAALGGFLLFGLHVTGKKLPLPLIAVHALAAVTAFVLLLVFAFA